MKETRYFGRTDVDGSIWAIYRYLVNENGLFEEVWNQNDQNWQPTTRLSGLWTGGDATLEEITLDQAMMAFPTAFPPTPLG